MLNVPSHEQFQVIGAFPQGLFPDPPSNKMQGMEPRSRDELKYMIEKYLRQIKGEERKEANLKAIVNTYIRQEEENSRPVQSPNHRDHHDRCHDKHNWHSRHTSHIFRPFDKDKPRSHRAKVHVVEKTPLKVDKEKGNIVNITREKSTITASA